MVINVVELLTHDGIIPLPKVGQTFSAVDIANELGTSASVVGKLASKLELKTDEHGIMVLDKSPYSNKQITTFRYNNLGKQSIIDNYKK